MKLSIALLLAFVAVAAASECAPNCKWQCDDPQCPAVCHPVCKRPNCEMKCEETPCAQCTIHCEKPTCSIRCPKEDCQKESCPHCETVCAPAQCHTTCTAPEPKCSPVCEELECTNKCAKPTNCAKPKCELQCEKAACEEKQATCCECNAATTQHAVNQAGKANGTAPSFVEVLDTMFFKHQQGETSCCPCAQH